MKRILCLVAVGVFLTGVQIASATDVRPYFDVHGGATINRDGDVSSGSKVSYDTGFVVGGAAGLDFELLRIEANVDFRKADITKVDSVSADGDLQITSYMLNVHFVPPVEYQVKPYLLAGAGFATAKIDADVEQERNTKFAYQFGGGFGFEATRNITLDLGYRFLGASDFDHGNDSLSYASHNFLIGMRYSY